MNLVADIVDHGAPVNARSVQSGETALHLVRHIAPLTYPRMSQLDSVCACVCGGACACA
jgi:hypothetical protein